MQRAEAAVVVVLPPEPVVAAAGTQRRGRLASRLLPTRLARPFAERQGGEQRAGCAPIDVVGRVGGVGQDERVQLVGERRVGGEPEGDEQRPRFAHEERSRVVMLIRSGVRLGALELDRAQRSASEVERGLGVAASPQRVERPDHAGCPDVEVLQR